MENKPHIIKSKYSMNGLSFLEIFLQYVELIGFIGRIVGSATSEHERIMLE